MAEEMRQRNEELEEADGRARLLALAGVAAPILFVGLILVLGALEPGYDHRTDTMSVLGGVEGWRGDGFNLGLALTGLLLLAFSRGLHQDLNKGVGARAGPTLIVWAGVGMLGSAYFSCNEGCTNVLQEPTLAGYIHILTSFITGLCLSIAPLVLFPRVKRDERWRHLAWFTLAMGILANIPGLTLWISMATTRIPEWEGLIQRLGILFPLLWVEVMAWRLLRVGRA